MKKRILFVDDESHILEGLRNRFRRHRKKWDMFFAGSGREALEVLSKEPIDVIVTDMRMPEMDGAELLTRVHADHPGVARIVLSGHAELEASLRVVPIAHQFLTKPCDEGVLEDVVERACNLQKLLSDEAIRKIVGGIEKLPPVPRTYIQLTAALMDQDVTADEVIRILKQDAALCAKLLQVVNSGFVRLARSITRVEDAVSYLGFDSIKQIALVAEVFPGSQEGKFPISMEELQDHAIAVGNLASKLFTDKQQKDNAFVVGLLHDIGKLVLTTEIPEHVNNVLNEMKSQDCSMHSAEINMSGATHAEIGGYLLGLWGLPYPIIEAVANHHNPTRVDSLEFGVLASTHIADALIYEEMSSGNADSAHQPETLDLAYVETLGLTENIAEWRKLAQELAVPV